MSQYIYTNVANDYNHDNLYGQKEGIRVIGGKKMTESNEVILWMENCDPLRLTANKVMLCTRNIFLLENMRDIFVDEYNAIIQSSGSAGIVKM
jgi:hypothetical protein